MRCRRCNYKAIPDDACFCPSCGQSVEIATRVGVRQDVEQNLGRVIGVQTEAIHGDVYGAGDIYQVQIYALGAAGRTTNWQRFLDKSTPPYKYLSPYTARDQALFKGRDDEIDRVVRQIGEQPQLVVYGPTEVGKTSLLAAGVTPRLMEYGALVVHLRDYGQPLEKTIREALTECSEHISVCLPEEPTLPALVRAICEATQGTLVLILDQFENLFEPSTSGQQQATLIDSLAQALKAVGPESLRLIVVVWEGALGRLGQLQDCFPHLCRWPIPLLPLNRKQARAAIEGPLAALEYPVSYVGDLVPKHLVPDLDGLTPKAPDQILPTYLQIVCYWLYQAASDRKPPHIDEELYDGLMGVEGTVARHVEDTLESHMPTGRTLARQLMQAMAYPSLGRWVPPESLPGNGSSAKQVCDTLEHLVEAQLLLRRSLNGRREYSFASPIVAKGIRRQAPPEVRRCYQVEEDLEHVWSAWMIHKALVSQAQLRYLEKASVHLPPPAGKLLLLLRSAVALDVPDNPWPARLRRAEQGPALIRQLEEAAGSDHTWYSDHSTLIQGKRLLGLMGPDDEVPRERPGPGAGAFGRVAWSAVGHKESVTRRTAALALTALEPYPQEALNRLEWALRARFRGWRHWLRKGEVRGTLVDADPGNQMLRSDLLRMDRLGMWRWRAGRRVIRQRHHIVSMGVAAGIGAGLALGLLRAGIGALAGQKVGIQFAMYFWWAWILGAALALGMALAEPLLLGRSEKQGTTPPIWRAPLHPDRLPALLAVLLGTLLFGLAHLLVAWFNGLDLTKAPLVAPMGFVAGVGLSLGLYGQPRAGWRLGIVGWLSRLGVAAVIFVLTQLAFILARDKGPSIAIAWEGIFYRVAFSGCETPWWQQFMSANPQWPEYLALLDAAVVGMVLTAGMTIAIALAETWLTWWRHLANQAED